MNFKTPFYSLFLSTPFSSSTFNILATILGFLSNALLHKKERKKEKIKKDKIQNWQ
jgi:hypothetical protein